MKNPTLKDTLELTQEEVNTLIMSGLEAKGAVFPPGTEIEVSTIPESESEESDVRMRRIRTKTRSAIRKRWSLRVNVSVPIGLPAGRYRRPEEETESEEILD